MVDDDIIALFNTVAQDIEPELVAVIGEATRQGRRRRARRRLAIVVTAGLSVVAIAVAATLLVNQAGRSVHGSPPVGPGHRRAAEFKPKTHRTHPAARHVVPQAHGPGMMPTQMLAVLRTLLPKGDITYVAPYYMRGWLELNFNDGKGAVDIIVAISRTTTKQMLEARYAKVPDAQRAAVNRELSQELKLAELYCPNPPLKDEGRRPTGAPPISCARSVLPDGDIVMQEVTEADVAGYYDLAVYVARPDGLTVSIDVGNGTLEGTPHLANVGMPWVDRAVPPGSLDFWQTVVQSPKWHL